MRNKLFAKPHLFLKHYFGVGTWALVLTMMVLPAQAQFHLEAASQEDFIYNEYFTQEKQTTAQVSLIRFVKVNEKFPLPLEKYDRLKHFGAWKNPESGSCLDTRGLVLKRDSSVDVAIDTHCKIISGNWFDPYTQNHFFRARDVQIDHLVPLKNAYMTGGYSWTPQQRCLYANFLGSKTHLIPVKAAENLKKGDQSPREYIPPAARYVCTYLRNWLEIKYVWSLRFTPTEVSQIQKEIQNYSCQESDFDVPQEVISQQHNFQEMHKNLCTP